MDKTFENDVFADLKKTRVRVATKAEGAKWEMLKITPAKLKSQMYKVISKYNSIYKDNSWENVHKLDKDLERILPNLAVIEAKYSHDEFGVPNRKRWTYSGAIEDNQKKKWVVIVDITAHGAGDIKDPLSRYDITCVVNVLRPSKVTDPDVLDYMAQYKVEEKIASKVAGIQMQNGKIYKHYALRGPTTYFHMLGRYGVNDVPFGVIMGLEGDKPYATNLENEFMWETDKPIEPNEVYSKFSSSVKGKINRVLKDAQKELNKLK